MQNSMEVPQKVKNRTAIQFSTSTSGHLSEGRKKPLIWKDICTAMFIAALFTIAKKWKQPKYLLIDEWIKMFCVYYMCIHTHTHAHTHAHTMECYSTIKRMKSCHLQQHG